MLDIKIIRSPHQPVGKFIQKALRDAVVCRIATAYLTSSALNSFERHFERILDHSGAISVVHGADGQITSPSAIRQLANLNLQYDGMEYRVHSPTDWKDERLFHPKIYFTCDAKQNCVSIVGSSNATSKGLAQNIEVNVVFKGRHQDSAIAQCSRSLDALFTDHSMVEPSVEWISIYEQIYDLRRSLRNSEANHRELNDLYGRLALLTPQVESWTPKTQEECVLKAVQELEREIGRDQGIHLNEIAIRARQIAQRNRNIANWKIPEPSIRRCMNRNTEGKDKHKWFIRVGGEDSKSGKYLLSEGGKRYTSSR